MVLVCADVQQQLKYVFHMGYPSPRMASRKSVPAELHDHAIVNYPTSGSVVDTTQKVGSFSDYLCWGSIWIFGLIK